VNVDFLLRRVLILGQELLLQIIGGRVEIQAAHVLLEAALHVHVRHLLAEQIALVQKQDHARPPEPSKAK